MVTDKLLEPRGYVWDGDGTIFVADRGGGAVYGLPSNSLRLRAMHGTETVRPTSALPVARLRDRNLSRSLDPKTRCCDR